MGAAAKYCVSQNSGKRMVLVLVTIAIFLQISVHRVQAQETNCSSTMSNLNVCAPFVVPGATNMNPSPDCCAAVQSIDHDCYCNTLRIAAQIPTHCNLTPLSCSGN